MSKILDDLKLAIVEGDDEAAPAHAEAAPEEGLSPVTAMNQAIVPGIEEAGKLWAQNKYFLPDVILAASAFKAATAVIQPKLPAALPRPAPSPSASSQAICTTWAKPSSSPCSPAPASRSSTSA